MKNLKWAVIFLFLIIICFVVIAFHRMIYDTPATAHIIQNGEVIREINLQNINEAYEFNVSSNDGGYNTIRVENGKIGIVSADCPDKICVHQGLISSGAMPVVCLPHRLSIVIKDNDGNIDAVTGGMP